MAWNYEHFATALFAPGTE